MCVRSFDLLQVVKGHSSHCWWRGSPSSNPLAAGWGHEVSRRLPGSYQGVTRGEQGVTTGEQGAIRGLPRGYQGVTRGLPGRSRGVRVSWGRSRGVRVSRGRSRGVRVSWRRSRGVRVSWGREQRGYQGAAREEQRG